MQFNVETEAALIGSCLKNTKAFQEVKELIQPDNFYLEYNKWAWAAMLELDSNGMGVDTVTVGDALERKGLLPQFTTPTKTLSGRPALSWVRDNGEPRNVTAYAADVADYAAKREIEKICTTGVNWAVNGRRANDIMADLTKRIGDIRTLDLKAYTHTQTLKEAISDAYDDTDKASRGETDYTQTGFIDIDYMLDGGLTAPDFMVIAGRPGQGKTALMKDIALNVATKGKRVVFFTLEMQNKQIAMRLLATLSGVTYGQQKRGKMNAEEWTRYIEAVEKLDMDIVLNDLPAITPNAMRRELRRINSEKKIDLVVVDYIQLQGADGEFQNRVLEIGAITRGIKSLCKEFDCPFIAGAQMSRAIEQRADKRPVLSDLRESGDIENDADIVCFIHKPEKDNKAVTELIFEKNRNGRLGIVDLYFHGELTKFSSAKSTRFAPNE